MPVIFRMGCENCKAEKLYSDVLLANTEDGAWHVLGHPCEDLDAAELGTSLDELHKEGRLHGGRAYLCIDCGEVCRFSGEPGDCPSCGSRQLFRGGNPPDSPGGPWALIFTPVIAILFLLDGAWLIGLSSLTTFVVVAVIGRRRSAAYRDQIAGFRCWSCGEKALRERGWGRS